MCKKQIKNIERDEIQSCNVLFDKKKKKTKTKERGKEIVCDYNAASPSPLLEYDDR